MHLDKLFARCCREARGDFTVQFLDQLFLLFAVGKPVEIPQEQFLDKLFARCLGSPWRSTSAFLEKVYIPFAVSGAVGQTVQNTVENPQSKFWDKVFMPVVVASVPMASAGTVDNSTVTVLGQGVHACRCWFGADGQTVQKTVVMPQLQFFAAVVFPCRAAKAYPHGLACSEDHRDSAVQ